MRFRTAITLGVVASGLVLAACDGPQAATAPNDPPSFAKISPQTQYTATLTCSAGASRTYATMIFQGVLGTFLFCNGVNQATATSFEAFSWNILLNDNAGTVKVCPRKGEVLGSASRTGQFTCKDAKTGLSAVLTIEPS
jgi:hypothetical protein